MRRIALSLALLAAPAALTAQLPGPSTRALGMGGAYTAIARGYEATTWNPALLAASGRPGFSIGLPHGALEFGSNAYGLSDFRRYADEALTDADKATLLGKVDSTLEVRSFAGVAPLALQIGRFAVSLGSSGQLSAGLGRDAVELMLYGNASRSGAGQFFTAAGSNGRGWAATTLAASYAMPFSTPMGRLSVGATAKKVWGHALGLARETSSQFQVNPAFSAQAAGHAIYTRYPSGYDFEGLGDLFSGDASPGSGFGVDVGGVLELPGITVAAVIVNAVGSMDWQADRLQYERGTYGVTQLPGGQVSDTQSQLSLTGAAIDGDAVARALRDTLLATASFSRLVRVGATTRLAGIRLAADGQLRLSEGLDRQPSQAVAAGAEVVLLGILPLRAGLATDFADGFTLSGGTGLHLGPVKLDVSIANISGTDRPGVIVGAGLGLVF